MLPPDIVPDLLGRMFRSDVLDVSSYLTDKVVLITGAGGSIGSHLCQRVLKFHPKILVLYEMSEYALYAIDHELQKQNGCRIIPVLGNLTIAGDTQRLLKTFHVDTIFHVAAYKHVPLVEYNPIVGLENNVFATQILVDAARQIDVANFVCVSTDKAVNPTNVMGASKRLAEFVTMCGEFPYKVVRFGNVLWSNGSVVPLFYQQLMTTKIVTITDPGVTRYFMSIEEAVDLILQSIAISEPLCVLDMGKPVQIETIAVGLAEFLGLRSQDWRVEYIGLRPGEKKHEELTLGESLHETLHPCIKAAHEKIPSYQTVMQWLRQLKLLCSKGDMSSIRMFLKEVVPGYNPSCGIVDHVWVEEYVVNAGKVLDDCYEVAERPLDKRMVL